MAEEIRADLLLGRDSLSPGLVKAGHAAKDAAGNVGDLTKKLYELGKQRATPVVDLNDKDATARLEKVTVKLDELGKKVASPRIDAKDKDALAKVAAMRVKLDALGNKVTSPRITLEGVGKAEAQIAALDLQLGRLGKRVRGPGLFSRIGGLFHGGGGDGGGGFLSGLGGLFSGGAQAEGAGAQAGGGFLSSLGQYGQPAAYGIAGILAALLGPAILPLGLGGLIGGGTAFGAIAIGNKITKQLQTLGKSLASAKGPQKQAIQAQIKALNQQFGPELALAGGFTDVKTAGANVFAQALKAPGPGNVLTGAAGPSFLTSLTGIFKQIAGFVKTLGPQLAGLFQASVPFLRTFVKFLEQAAKTLLPVFTHLLNQFVASGALKLMAQGLVEIVDALAGFLKALGPQGMQASAKIFLFLTKLMAAALPAIGKAINWLVENIPKWVHDIAKWWDWLRHHTATVFDGIRHDIAHYWDLTFQDTIGAVIRFGHNVEALFNGVKRFAEQWALRVELIFLDWAKTLVHAAADAFGWVPGLGGKLKAADKALGSFIASTKKKLYDLTHHTYSLDFAVALPGGGPSNLRGPGGQVPIPRAGGGGVPSGQWAMVGERGPELAYFAGGGHVIPNHAIKGYAAGSGEVTVHLSLPSIQAMSRVLSGAVAAIVRSVQSRYGGTLGGVSGLGRSGLRYLENLWMSAGGPGGGIAHIAAAIALAESGGNPRAFNPSGASGLWQILGQVVPGNIFNPFVNAVNAVTKYRDAGGFSPWVTYTTGAYRQFLDQGGWLRPGWNLAYNGTGRPERVIPHNRGGSGGGATYYVTVQVGHGTHPVAAAQELVKLLNVGARNGVRLRTSILGPG